MNTSIWFFYVFLSIILSGFFFYEKTKLSLLKKDIFSILFTSFFLGVLGGKWMHVLWDSHGIGPLELLSIDPFHGFRLLEPGYVFLGSALGAFLGFSLCIHAVCISKDEQMDLYVHWFACLGLALGIGRLGCFFQGCCYGILLYGIAMPVILVESFFGFFVFFTIKKRNFKTQLLSYLVLRFFVEFLRADSQRNFLTVFNFPFSSAQIACFILFFLSWIWRFSFIFNTTSNSFQKVFFGKRFF